LWGDVNVKILIVDDDRLVLRAVSRLARRGYAVHAVWSHPEAMAYARDWADVALVDIDMPERSGPELVRLFFPPSLPVVFHTGNPEGVPRGARYVAKPASVDEIIAELEAAQEKTK